MYIMQETTGNDVTRMCRNDKIMYAIFALNIAIIVIWSITLNLGAPAKNTERKEANVYFAQTEKLQNSVELKEENCIVPLVNVVHEEIEEATISFMVSEAYETADQPKQFNFETFNKSILHCGLRISEIVTDSSRKCNKNIEELEQKISKTANEVPATEAVTQENAVETEVTVEEIPAVEHPVYMEEYVEPEPVAPVTYSYNGPVLSAWAGTVQGPSGKETYYNLDMSGVISIMNQNGYYYDYWIRSDGCKMFGDYIMCAANFNIHPRGSLVETSLGTGIVCDTGTFAYGNPYQIDIATTW